MTYTLAQLEAKLRIDEHALDVALREQPDLVYAVSQQLALAISERDQAKLELEEQEAETAIDLREDAEANDEKITDKSVEAQVKADPSVQRLAKTFIKSKAEAAKWAALQEAYEQRSYALNKLVDLYLANYYGNFEKTGGDYKNIKAKEVKEELATRRKRVGARE